MDARGELAPGPELEPTFAAEASITRRRAVGSVSGRLEIELDVPPRERTAGIEYPQVRAVEEEAPSGVQ